MKYTIDNPKLVESFHNPGENNFTGVVKDKCGDIAYYESDLIHRTDGPAVIHAYGRKEWRIYGKRHREDGPAIEWADGKKYWYYHGKYYGVNADFTIESWIKKCKLEVFK